MSGGLILTEMLLLTAKFLLRSLTRTGNAALKAFEKCRGLAPAATQSRGASNQRVEKESHGRRSSCMVVTDRQKKGEFVRSSYRLHQKRLSL